MSAPRPGTDRPGSNSPEPGPEPDTDTGPGRREDAGAAVAATVRASRGMARYALVACVLAVAAAVVSFVNGSWLGVVWVLLAGLTSNMAWYFRRRARFVAGGSTAGG